MSATQTKLKTEILPVCRLHEIEINEETDIGDLLTIFQTKLDGLIQENKTLGGDYEAQMRHSQNPATLWGGLKKIFSREKSEEMQSLTPSNTLSV